MQSVAHAELEGDRCGISLEKSKATHPMAERLNNNNLNSNDIFNRNRTILRCVRNHKGPRIAKANLRKENKLEASHF